MEQKVMLTNLKGFIQKHPKLTALILVACSGYFIYKGGYAVGEFLYTVTR